MLDEIRMKPIDGCFKSFPQEQTTQNTAGPDLEPNWEGKNPEDPAKAQKRAETYLDNAKSKGIAATAEEYLSIAHYKKKSWMKENIWSKLDMKTLVALRDELKEITKYRIDGCFGGKSSRTCAAELADYIRQVKIETEGDKEKFKKLPEEIKPYDENRDGVITEDEVENLGSFAKVIREMNVDDRKAALESLSPGLRLKLLEMLFKNDEKDKIEKLPYRPNEEEKPNKIEIIPLYKNKIRGNHIKPAT